MLAFADCVDQGFSRVYLLNTYNLLLVSHYIIALANIIMKKK